ncbi:hypothetical protein GCM10028801_31370 [Nocardioides maradonensis]
MNESSEAMFSLMGNVFDVKPEESRAEIAVRAWETVKRWVEEGYRPVVLIQIDGINCDIDLEEVPPIDDPYELAKWLTQEEES